MSRMTTSRASLSWAMPAMRRACSSGVRARMLATVQAELRDQLGDARRHQIVDRLTAREALPHLARRDGERLDLEEEHTFRVFELGQDAAEPVLWISRPRCDREAHALEDGIRFLPLEEVA